MDHSGQKPTPLRLELDLSNHDPGAFVEGLNAIAEEHQTRLQAFKRFILTDESINIEMVDGPVFEGPRDPAEFVLLLLRILSLEPGRK